MPTVLSVFDGISCGHYVLSKLGVTNLIYYASEVNVVAESVSNNHFPDIVRLGDVTQWRTWLIDWSSIDLFIGGSPCQGFSSAGDKGGTKAVVNGETIVIDTRELYLWAKQQGAKFLSESHLFWEYVLILDHIKLHNPRVKFMLENVKMSQNNLTMITQALGVEPVFINSATLSAQNRQRHYWCNWYVPEPSDRGIMLDDILEQDLPAEWDHSQAAIDYMDRVGSTGRVKWSYALHSDTAKGKSQCMVSTFHKGVPNNMLVHRYDRKSGFGAELDKALPVLSSNFRGLNRNQGQSAVCEYSDGQIARYRKFTPVECERLQGLPDNFTLGPSNTQRYIMLGNAWQCDTIEHIFFWLLVGN